MSFIWVGGFGSRNPINEENEGLHIILNGPDSTVVLRQKIDPATVDATLPCFSIITFIYNLPTAFSICLIAETLNCVNLQHLVVIT